MSEQILDLIEMEEAIELLKTSRPTFYRWLKGGKIKGTKVGKKWKFQKEDIERFMKGEAPKINIPVDIRPLLSELENLLKELNIQDIAPEEFDDLEICVLYIMALACAKNATDIHISVLREEFGGEMIGSLRMRIYGNLQIIAKFNPKLVQPILDVWKKWAKLDINNKFPQEGRILMEFDSSASPIANKSFNLINQFLQTQLGESLTARVLNIESFVLLTKLSDLGFSKHEEEIIKKSLNKPSGLILTSGPSGSGKSTTLFQFLKELIHPAKKIVTIENPVEVVFPWVTQIPAGSAEMTFEQGIRYALRSDAEVIMVSDTPNPETIRIILDAATSGHLVLSNFHSQNTFEMLRRIMDAGKDNLYQVIDSINLLTSQRLVKQLCPHCKEEIKLSAKHIEELNNLSNNLINFSKHEGAPIYKAVGCDKCNKGFKGRIVFYEFLLPSEKIKRAVTENSSAHKLMEIGLENGITPLVLSGLKKILEGKTTIEEVINSLSL